jgi:hypothetical protein
MTTHFITAEVDLQAASQVLPEIIETQLKVQGEPLRWAITGIKDDQAQVEAVVLTD